MWKSWQIKTNSTQIELDSQLWQRRDDKQGKTHMEVKTGKQVLNSFTKINNRDTKQKRVDQNKIT